MSLSIDRAAEVRRPRTRSILAISRAHLRGVTEQTGVPVWLMLWESTYLSADVKHRIWHCTPWCFVCLERGRKPLQYSLCDMVLWHQVQKKVPTPSLNPLDAALLMAQTPKWHITLKSDFSISSRGTRKNQHPTSDIKNSNLTGGKMCIPWCVSRKFCPLGCLLLYYCAYY